MKSVLKKSVPIWLLALISVMIAAPVVAIIVINNKPAANVSLTVRKAEASWELVEIELGEVNSGASFVARGNTSLTIANGENLGMSFAVITLTEEEMEALESLTIKIGEDTNEDGEIDVMWGTIEALPLPIPWPAPFALSEGVYNVVILVEGIAGYPEVETPIAFVVQGTCEALPLPLP